MKNIPLRSRSGEIRAYAIVDDADYKEIGHLRWSIHDGRRGCMYVARQKEKRRLFLHRHILGLTGSKDIVDHINGNGLDNRRVNLRKCTVWQNAANRGAQANNSSGHKGVSWHPTCRKWDVRITVKGKQHWLGIHESLAEAIEIYKEAAFRLHGEFANTGALT